MSAPFIDVELIPEELPAEEKILPFWEHVGELRERLIKSALALFAGTAAAYLMRFELWEIAKRPLLKAMAAQDGVLRVGSAFGAGPFAYTDLSEPFFSMMRLSFWTAVFAVSPFLFYQVWAFVRPALREREKTMATTFVLVTSACFIAGALFAYYVAFPVLGDVLLAEAARAGLRANLRPSEYLNLFVYTVAGTGIIFEAPVLFYFLGRFGLVTSGGMLRYWREATVGMMAASALLTPGDVIATTILFGVVLLGLYFVSTAVVWAVERRA